MDTQVPGDDRAKKRRPPPREPMEGGSQSRPSVADDAAGMAAVTSCDACDCGGFPLLRLSLLLTVAALLLPASAGGPVAAMIRFYRRLLTRFTPACPSSPSCSTYALDAVRRLGARRGLAAAAARVRCCGEG